MGGDRPKVMADLLGYPMIDWVLEAALVLEPNEVWVVLGYGRAQVEAYLASRPAFSSVGTVEQAEQLGTGHAVDVCRPFVSDPTSDVLILYGDSPRIEAETLTRLLGIHRERGADATLLVGRLSEPTGYGRILRTRSGELAGIREEADASESERSIEEVNPGYYCFRGAALWRALEGVGCDNAQGEYYLTDAVLEVVRAGGTVETVPAPRMDELRGVNSLVELAERRREALGVLWRRHQSAGVDILSPESSYLERDVSLGAGTRVWPGAVLRGTTQIGRRCEIGPGAVITGASRLEDGVRVGAHAVVESAVIGAGAVLEAGVFVSGVEVEANAHIERAG